MESKQACCIDNSIKDNKDPDIKLVFAAISLSVSTLILIIKFVVYCFGTENNGYDFVNLFSGKKFEFCSNIVFIFIIIHTFRMLCGVLFSHYDKTFVKAKENIQVDKEKKLKNELRCVIVLTISLGFQSFLLSSAPTFFVCMNLLVQAGVLLYYIKFVFREELFISDTDHHNNEYIRIADWTFIIASICFLLIFLVKEDNNINFSEGMNTIVSLVVFAFLAIYLVIFIVEYKQQYHVANKNAFAMFKNIFKEIERCNILTESNNYIIAGDANKSQMNTYHLILAPTYSCNLRCKHCYLPHHKDLSLSYEMVRQIIIDWNEVVQTDKGLFGGIIHLKGGEPLMMKGFDKLLQDIIELKSLGLMITTNGTLLKNDILDLFEKAVVELKGDVIINLSLDGASVDTHDSIRGEGTFNKSIIFLKELNRRSIPTHINYVLNKTTLPEIEDILDLAEKYNVAQVNFLPFVAKSSGANIIDQVLSPKKLHDSIEDVFQRSDEKRKKLLVGTISDILKKEKESRGRTCECIAGYKGFYYITPNGEVFPCPNLMDEEFSLGNIHDISIKDIHSHKVAGLYKNLELKAGSCSDYSCKGAVKYYEQNENDELVKAYHDFNKELNRKAENTQNTAEMAFCFSRNI